MKQRAFRLPTRWEVAAALLFVSGMLVVIGFRVTKICNDAFGRNHYCGLDETFAWLREGGNWEAWIYLGLLVVGLLAITFSRDGK